MKRKRMVPLPCFLLLAGCGVKAGQAEDTAQPSAYTQISAEEARSMMDEQTDYILLDVRTQAEYDEGHIAGARLIPDSEIADRAEAELPDREATILVYCRSGRRSKLAAQALADLGYTKVYELGGIIDWPYETVK